MTDFIVDTLSDHDSGDEIDQYFNENNNTDENEQQEEDIVVGIDLGTTNSCVAVWRNHNLEIIPDRMGNRTVPSCVAFTDITKYVGKEAQNQIEINPENSFYEVKRMIGKKITDTSVQQDKRFITYELDQDEQNNVVFNTNLKTSRKFKKQYTPEEISAFILMELKYNAEQYLKKPVTRAVITVPAYFNDGQRQATADAARIAGIECLRIINEPTAAAMAYGVEKITTNSDINVLVYDLGGGTLDVSILNICDNDTFTVLASTGNTHLGGADFDNRLVNWAKNEFKKKYQISKLKNISLISLQKLRKSCENAKKTLSVTGKTVIAVKDFYDNKDLLLTITRKQYETLCRDLFILCLKYIDDALESAGLQREEIDEIILVGGATRTPLIRNNLKLYFNGKEPNSSVNPDEVVAAGAAIRAYMLSHKDDPFSESVTLVDIIPLSLGVETIGGVMDVLIPRNSAIPVTRTKKYSTDTDYETSVMVKVFEGERKMTVDNFLVGEFELKGLEPAPRGVPEILITFKIDVNGITSVTAEDIKNEENKNSITVTCNKGRLKPDDIKQLIKEAKDMELRDNNDRQKKELFYSIEDLSANVLSNLSNKDFQLKETDKEMIKDDIDKIQKWLQEKSINERELKEYQRVIKRIKEKYGTLIMRVSNINSLKAAGEGQDKGTTVFGTEDDEETVFQEVINKELGFNDKTDEETKKEIKELREQLMQLCYSVFEIMSTGSLNIDDDNITELRSYLDDVLLWVHVQEKISKNEYVQKIEEINRICNDIVEKNKDRDIFVTDGLTIKTKRDELEQLCYALLSSIHSNMFAVEEKQITLIKNKAEGTLDYLLEMDVESKRAELEGRVFEISENMIQTKIDEINDLCNDLYNSLLKINIRTDTESIIIEQQSNMLDNNVNGSSIDSLDLA